MGFKASCVLVSGRRDGGLGDGPRHDPARAAEIVRRVAAGRHRSAGMTSFEEGMYPERLVVGAYDGASIIGHPDIGLGCLSRTPDPLTARVLGMFPDAAVLRVGLHSVVNLWSYTIFERGTLVRAYAGTADDGVVLDEGELLAEERPHFERSVVRDGVRHFVSDLGGQEEEFDASCYGETLVFEVMARFLGCRPDAVCDAFDPIALPMEAFEPEPARRLWWWPFGGR